jgi:hypothetical protein
MSRRWSPGNGLLAAGDGDRVWIEPALLFRRRSPGNGLLAAGDGIGFGPNRLYCLVFDIVTLDRYLKLPRFQTEVLLHKGNNSWCGAA